MNEQHRDPTDDVTEEAQLPRRYVVRTTHGGIFRRGGIAFSPNPTTITVAELNDPSAHEVSAASFAEILEAARPAIVENPDPRTAQSTPFVESGRVLAVTDAETGLPVYPASDALAIAEGRLPASMPGPSGANPAAIAAGEQRAGMGRLYGLTGPSRLDDL